MSSAVITSKTESRLDYEVNQASHGFSVGTILTHTGSAYAAALNTDEIVGVVSEVADTNNFTIQTHGRVEGLSSLTAGSQYYVSDSSAGTATTTDTNTPIYVAISTTEAVINNYTESSASGGGDIVLISTATASNTAAIEFTGLDNTYTTYRVFMTGVKPANDAQLLRMRTSTNNGSTYDSGSGNYNYHLAESVGGSAQSYFSSSSITYMYLAGATGNATGETLAGTLTIHNLRDSSAYPSVVGHCILRNQSNSFRYATTHNWRVSTTVVDAIQIAFNVGNISAGTFKLYGIK